MTHIDNRAGRYFVDQREYVFVRDAKRETGLSDSYITRLAKARSIPSCKLGKNWLVDRDAVRTVRRSDKDGEQHGPTGDEIVFDGRGHVSAHEAARAVDVSGDYIARLAREGRTPARRLGRNWFVDRDAVRTRFQVP